MSLLLDALKKSESQRRRGTTPTIDLTSSPPKGRSRRIGFRWSVVLLLGVMLVAAGPWLWPQFSDWLEKHQGIGGEADGLAEVNNAEASTVGGETVPGRELQSEALVEQPAPAPVAGASSQRRVAAADPSPDASNEVGETDRATESTGAGSETSSSRSVDNSAVNSSADNSGDAQMASNERAAAQGSTSSEPTEASKAAAPDTGPSVEELQRIAQQQQQRLARASAPSEPKAAPTPQVTEPIENFIRPWELPEAQRAEFPELKLTVHFFSERPVDRFVLINGERYGEGQRVGPGARLAEIRRRGAVVEFGSYRVLIE